MNPDLRDMLVGYLAVRDQQRHDRATELLATLTGDELALVREAATRGYALGWQRGAAHAHDHRRWSDDADFPTDTAILTAVAAGFRPRKPLPVDQLGPRQQWLFHEAAVMGYVLGDRAGGVDTRAGRAWAEPAAEETLTVVVQHCQSTSEIYPVLGGSPRALVSMLMRRADGRVVVSRSSLVAAMAVLMPDDAGRVENIVAEYLADGELAEHDDVLSIGSPDESMEDR